MTDDGYVVRRPRESDAIGRALQNAFVSDKRVPHDLLRVLDRIDRPR